MSHAIVEVLSVEWVVALGIAATFLEDLASALVLVESDESGSLLTLSSKNDNDEHDHLVDGVTEDVSPHDIGDDLSVLMVRRSLENILFRRLGGECESSEGVHDKVDPEHLDGVERHVLEDDSAEEDNEHGYDVDSELELEELADVVEDGSAELESDNDGGEVVIHEDDVRGTLGDIGASDTHGEADISSGESGSIVGTVTGNSDNTVTLLDAENQQVLVIRRASTHDTEVLENVSEHALVFDDVVTFVILTEAVDKFSELRTSQARILGIELLFIDDASVERNSSCSVKSVTSAHNGTDTSISAASDGLLDADTEGILETE